MSKLFKGPLGVIVACVCCSALTLGAVALTTEGKSTNKARAGQSDGPGGPDGPFGNEPGAVRDTFFASMQAIGKQTPTIAKPILDQAVSQQKITQAQADQISQRLTMFAAGPPRPPAGGPPRGERPHGPPPGGGPGFGPGDQANANVRAVMKQIFDAVAKQAPSIGKPVVDAALAAQKITQAQADELNKRLANFGAMHVGPCAGPLFSRSGRRPPPRPSAPPPP